ncbi:hypothetical protein K4F52_003812 [Lecanicillium sp. MT-2017a]|nr:hypothetical protein K4F52_003812 [Lecanicillium sp. MT-2017a]
MAEAAAPLRGRSNSLQRMLELERQYMFERFHSAVPSTNRRPVPPQQSEPPRASFSNSQTTIQARRSESQVNKHNQKSNQRPHQQSPCPQPPRLVIDVNTAAARSQGIAVRGSDNTMKPKRNPPAVTIPPSIPYSATVEALPASGSPSRHSVCMSPSWEAYDRHRKEKKHDKRAKEEAKASQGKPRRLSKPPPASSPYTFDQINRRNLSDTHVFNAAPKDQRPMSMIALDTSPPENAVYRQPRSRSSSFTSLLQSPFDFRRSSVDHGAEPAFIGGIKLEAEKQAVHQKLLDEDTCAVDAEVHPALRKEESGQRRSAPLKSPPPPPRGSPKETKDPNRRAYPPITRMTTKNKTLSLISPTAPAVPDLSIIEKWRARVGLKSSPRRASMDQKAKMDVSTMSESVSSAQLQSDLPQKTVTPDLQREDTDALQPPPEPPRRSSKRNSTMNLSASSVCLSSPSQSPRSAEQAHMVHNASEATSHKDPSSSPSWENLQSSVMDAIEKNVRPMQHGEPAFWNSREWAVERGTSPLQAPCSSSDDSASDCFNTVSMPSTPNTSRPQSEKGFPQLARQADGQHLPRIELYDKAYASETCSVRSFQQQWAKEQDTDPIQAAAMNVMDSYPTMSETKDVAPRYYQPSWQPW